MRILAIRALGALLASGWFQTTAFAADAEPAGARLEEIVVTAQKRAQNIQEVGTSISAIDGAQLSKLGLRDTTDIVRQVPGLQFNQFSADITVFNLRGVSQNDFSDHEEAPVAVYSDEAYIASMGAIAGSMFDLERVEVLRGPQGTLFGRNATGGLIHYLSQKPTDSPDAYITVTGGSFGQINTEGAINGPLTDRIDARLSFATGNHQGIIKNRIGVDTENQKQYAARLQFLVKINDDANLLLKVHGIRNPNETGPNYTWRADVADPATGLGHAVPANVDAFGTCPGCDMGGYRNPSSDPYNQAYDRIGFFDRSVYGATAHVDWKLSTGVSLTSVTDYLHMRKRYGEDADMSPNPLMTYDTWQAYHQFSEELRLDGQSGVFKWITGVYFLDMQTNDWAAANFGGAFADFGSTGNVYALRTHTIAGFAQGEWAMTERLAATLGGRFTRDEKINDYALYSPFEGAPPVFLFNRSTNPDLADQVYNLPSWKAELDYKLATQFMIYASVNRGAKGGGFDEPVVPPITAASDLPFRPERLTSYEIGEKATFWDGRARLNADVFYYDYRDYQAFELIDGLTLIVKNYPARIKGGELELTVLPVRNLELQLGVSGLATRIENVVLPSGLVADRQMPQAPKWSINALARYQWQALSSTWWIQADAKTDTAMNFEAFNPPVDYEPGKTVANFRVGYTSPDGKLDVNAFCNNFTDRRYRVYSLDSPGLGWNVQVYAPPRWYGVTVSYHLH